MTQINTDDGAGSSGCLPSYPDSKVQPRPGWRGTRCTAKPAHQGSNGPGGSAAPNIDRDHEVHSRAGYFRWEITDADWSNEMTDVTFTNRRADSSANEDLTKLARHGADTFGYKASLRIDRQLAQLLRLRVSQINNCAYCLNLHYEAARDAGIPRPVIDTLTAWWETDFHNDAARAALAYTEAMTRVADATVADDFGARHDALAEHFSREEILEIIGVVINMNVWTRLKVAEGAVPGLAEQVMS